MGQLFFADEIHTVEQAKIEAARVTQKSGNARRASDAALQNFSASLANMRRLDAAGEAVADSNANSVRIQQQLTTGRLSDRIRAAEELGVASVQAGAAGVGGASVEAYSETVRLNNAIREQSIERSFEAREWAAGQQRGNAVKAAVAGLDNNAYRANIDYTQYLDHKKPGFLERTIGLAATAAATVYGGPQAGQAVMGMFEAKQAAANGDFAGATANISGAFQNGMGAMRAYNATRSGPEAFEPQAPDLSGLEAKRNEFAQEFFNRPAPTWGSVTLK